MPLYVSKGESTKTTTYLWSSVIPRGDTPPHGCCHSLVNYKDEFLVLFGGGALHYVYNDVYCFDLKTFTWTYKETINGDIVAPRISHSAVVYGDNMYVYGGYHLYMPVLFSEVLVLNLKTFTWSCLHHAPPEPEGPGERRLHSAHVYRDHMYVLMGEPCSTSTCFWYLDFNTHKWHPVQSFGLFGKPIVPLIGHSAQVEGDYLYVFGGYHTHTMSQTGSFVYSNSLFYYHFLTNMWREVLPYCGPRPFPRYSSAMVVLQGRVYIHGGDNDGNVYFEDFWCIHTKTQLPRWIDLTLSCGKAHPSARSGHAYVLAQGSLFVYGGELPGDTDVLYYSNRFYRYPLGLFTHLSLTELASRWLAKSNQVNVRVLQECIPRGPRAALSRNSPEAVTEDVDALMPCTRSL
ncbi:kelch domain-containing protein 3 [Trypanosoma cruzi]|nr:kelch domain-containing protein 3 [Trypanosoma cruzi]